MMLTGWRACRLVLTFGLDSWGTSSGRPIRLVKEMMLTGWRACRLVLAFGLDSWGTSSATSFERRMLFPSGCPEGETLMSEVADAEGGLEDDNDCKKNHNNYIPVVDFCIEHLPKELQTKKIFDSIMNRCTLTVKITVTYISQDRPEMFDDGTPYPYAEHKGTTKLLRGTGTITNILPKPITTELCQCRQCTKKGATPKTEWWVITLLTATHVVFDDVEANSAVIDCFYDKDGDLNGVEKLFGYRILNNIIRINTSCKSDLCEVLCVTHDKAIVDKLWPALSSNGINGNPTEQMSQIIVSHPHGRGKRISIGEVLELTVPVQPVYETGKPFCFMDHTNCRLNLRSNVKETDSESARASNSLNTTHTTSLPSCTDTTSSQSTNTDNVMHISNNFSSANAFLYLPLLDGLVKTWHYISRQQEEGEDCSKEDIMSNLISSFPDSNSLVNDLKGISSEKPEPFKRKVEDYFYLILNNNQGLYNQGDPQEVKRVKSKILDIVFPKFFHLIYKQTKNDTVEIESGKLFKEECADVFALIQEAVSKTYGKIHPEFEILTDYLETNFEFLMQFVLSFLRREEFALTRVCPDAENSGSLPPRPGSTLQSGTTFTLPSDADFAFTFDTQTPGWFKFPPGTIFNLSDGKLLDLPDDVEFRNETLYPEHGFLTYDIDTCPGSSGAAVYCNVIGVPFMATFPHRGCLKVSRKNRSGVQSNEVCTILANVFKTIRLSDDATFKFY